MRTAHDAVLDDLAALVAGEPDAIARHAEHLASCDECRDARHDAATLARQLGDAGADYVPAADLVDRVMAKVDAAAQTTPKPAAVEMPRPAATDAPETEAAKPAAPRRAAAEAPRTAARIRDIASAPSRRRTLFALGALGALAASAGAIYLIKHRNHAVGIMAVGDGPIGKVKTISRAAVQQGDGLAIRTAMGWRA